MSASPFEDFELALVPQSTNRGLARRLMDGRLRPDEQAYLARVEEVVKLEAEGMKFPQIAEVLGWTAEKIYQWTRSAKYRLFAKYVADRALLQGEAHAHERRRAERRRWDSNGHKALDYYDQAFRRHTKDNKSKGVQKGDFVDLDRAERAAKLFAESAGWTEPVPQTAKPKDLKLGVIQAAMHAIAAADRRETVVRVTLDDTKQTTTVEVASRDETATMGG